MMGISILTAWKDVYVFIAAMGYFQPVIKLMMNSCVNVINNKCCIHG